MEELSAKDAKHARQIKTNQKSDFLLHLFAFFAEKTLSQWFPRSLLARRHRHGDHGLTVLPPFQGICVGVAAPPPSSLLTWRVCAPADPGLALENPE